MKKPKIRFKGFTETWEQRKLGDLCKIITKGTTPKDKTNRGDVNFIKVENINPENGEISNTTKITLKEHEENLKRSRLLENDILFSIAGTLGRVAIIKSSILPANTNQALAIIRLSEGDISFIATMLKGRAIEDYIRKNPTVGAQPNLSLEQISNFVIPFTLATEQKKIGSLFSKLDHLITLHQRKCENLKKLKKFMLQKLFPQNGENVPKVRFLNFTDTWEQRKLETYLQEYNEVTSTNNQYPALTSSRKGLFLQTDYFSGNQVASENNIGYNVVPYGYFTYRHMSDDEVFHFNINDIVDKGIVSTLYPVFTTSKELDSKYLQYQLNYGEEFSRFARLQKQGGSRTYMYLNKLRKLSLTMPNTLDEQKEISAILSTLDHLITLHQRKCDKLKEVKKYMLQNMFA